MYQSVSAVKRQLQRNELNGYHENEIDCCKLNMNVYVSIPNNFGKNQRFGEVNPC